MSAMATILIVSIVIAASLGACIGAAMMACVSINRGKSK
jgi:hypothetical protein